MPTCRRCCSARWRRASCSPSGTPSGPRSGSRRTRRARHGTDRTGGGPHRARGGDPGAAGRPAAGPPAGVHRPSRPRHHRVPRPGRGLRRDLHRLPGGRGQPDGLPQLEAHRPHRHLVGGLGELPRRVRRPGVGHGARQHRRVGGRLDRAPAGDRLRARAVAAPPVPPPRPLPGAGVLPPGRLRLPHRHPVPLPVQQRVRRGQRPAPDGGPDRRAAPVARLPRHGDGRRRDRQRLVRRHVLRDHDPGRAPVHPRRAVRGRRARRGGQGAHAVPDRHPLHPHHAGADRAAARDLDVQLPRPDLRDDRRRPRRPDPHRDHVDDRDHAAGRLRPRLGHRPAGGRRARAVRGVLPDGHPGPAGGAPVIGKETTAGRTTKFAFLGLWLLFTAFPLFWIAITSVKAPGDVFAYPIAYWPETFSLEKYRGLFDKADFGVYLANSLVVSTVAAATATVISMLSGYVLARFEFRSKSAVLMAALVTQMIPAFIALGPLYLLMTDLSLVDNRLGLALVYIAMCIPFCTVMLLGFFANVPEALEEAAMIDGLTRLGALFRVLLPVMRPGIVAAFIFNFVNCWNELFLSVTLMN